MLRACLLIVTALVEVGAGLPLLCLPSVPIALLLGVDRAAPESSVVARVAGASLCSLGAACWLARKDARSRAATGLIAAMLLYNTTVAAILAFAGIVDGLVGICLWPAVVLHAAMAGWCVACLRDSWIDLDRV